MKKFIVIVLVLVAAGAGVWAYMLRRNTPEPTVTTQPFSRGDVVESVGATGTLQAVETVDVGTQVSGVIDALYADFNSIVKKGQVIARLDPQLIQTQIEQQTANVTRAEADLERLRVSLADARQKLTRAQQMSEKNLIPRTELETAEVNVKVTEAQIQSSEAALSQAKAQLNNQKVNLGYTTIRAPIDGIVISRNVDQGQTVAASMNAPTLYVIAADLTKMEVLANIDEADVGRMRPGQPVTFRVDAFPTDTFRGTVSQVRLQPAVVQNVVTYSTVISVPNPDLKLKPGMTANVSIEIARRDNVLRVPNAATRFRPTTEMFAALNQPVPPELERGRGGFGRGQRAAGGGPEAAPAGAGPSGGTTAAAGGAAQNGGPAARPGAQGQRPAAGQRDAAAQAPQQARGANAAQWEGTAPDGRPRQEGAVNGRGTGSGRGFDPNMTPEERRKRMEERLASMTPEERERFEARMREGGGRFGGNGQGGFRGDPAAGPRQGSAAGSSPRGAAAAPAARAGRQGQAAGGAESLVSKTMSSGATTIDSLFGPLPQTETRATAWQYENKQLKMLRLRLGVSDGTYSEVLNEADIPPDAELVTNMSTGLERTTTMPQNQGNNPLMGPQRGGPGGRGPGGPGRGR
jgi:HlyD family secretion protein